VFPGSRFIKFGEAVKFEVTDDATRIRILERLAVTDPSAPVIVSIVTETTVGPVDMNLVLIRHDDRKDEEDDLITFTCLFANGNEIGRTTLALTKEASKKPLLAQRGSYLRLASKRTILINEREPERDLIREVTKPGRLYTTRLSLEARKGHVQFALIGRRSSEDARNVLDGLVANGNKLEPATFTLYGSRGGRLVVKSNAR
jgi:hypothetical protein